jgi:hypothetical protein
MIRCPSHDCNNSTIMLIRAINCAT